MAGPISQGDNGNANASTTTGILNDVWDERSHTLRMGSAGGGLVASKTVTFTGAAGNGAVGTVPLFTVSGQVLVALIAVCSTSLTGASATIAVGNSTTSTRYLPQQTATNITAGKTWDLTGLVSAGTAPNTTPNQVAFDTEAIIATIATANVTGGVLTFYAYYKPLTSGATVS